MAGGQDVLAAGITATNDLLMTGINNAVNWRVAQENRNLQRETNEKNEALMREAWARDDTARQRMVKDLEAAGLSKWLATGASPMTSSPISLTAPQNDFKMNLSADGLSHAYQNMLQFAQTRQETENAKETGKVIAHQVDEAEARARIAQHDADVFEKRSDVASTDPAYLKYISEALNTILGRNETGGKIHEGVSQVGDVFHELGKKQLAVNRALGNAIIDTGAKVGNVAKTAVGSQIGAIKEDAGKAKDAVVSGSKKVSGKIKQGYNKAKTWLNNKLDFLK